MVTFIETGLFEYFGVIFPALLVFVIVYGFFEKIGILGKSKSLNAIVAISIAFLVMLSKDILALISFIAPWFVLLFIFITLLLMVYMIFGVKEEEIAKAIWNDQTILWTIFVISVIIIGAGAAHVFGQRLLPLTQEGGLNVDAADNTSSSGSFISNIGGVLFHPKVVGTLFVLLVSVFTIALLTKEAV